MVEEKPNSAVHKILFEGHATCHRLRCFLDGLHDFLFFTVKIDVFRRGPDAPENRCGTTNDDKATGKLRGIDVATDSQVLRNLPVGER
jgi:hypothetical protein